MKRNRLAINAGLTLLLALIGQAALGVPQTPKALYTHAVELDRDLRASAATATLAEYRRVIAAYDGIVRRFPTSGYVDNALWQGAGVALDAFGRFGEERDRATARRFLDLLANQYPASPFVPKAWEALKNLEPQRPAVEARPGGPPAHDAAPPAVGTPTEPAVVLRDIRRTVLADGVRISIELDGRTPYRSERVDGPPRVLFDLSNTRLGEAVPEGTLSYDSDVARLVRIGRHPNQMVRVVVDLTDVARYRVTTTERPFGIVIYCQRPAGARATPAPSNAPRPAPPPVGVPPATSAASAIPRAPSPVIAAPALGADVRVGPQPGAPTAARPRPAARPLNGRPLRVVSAPAPFATSADLTGLTGPLPAFRLPRRTAHVLAPTVASSPPSVPAVAAELVEAAVSADPRRPGPTGPISARPPQAPAAAAEVLHGPFSLARQLGLGASRVVIDPGHGGHDPGALGQRVSEAEVVLDVALKLEALLREVGIEVVMTRRTDQFVPLEDRPAIAMREQGDLFLSIHANASRRRTVRGVESYVLNFATDMDAEEVAARENASTGRTLGNLPEIVKAIALNSKLDESRSFASLIQRAMAAELKDANPGLRNLGVKQAPFVVLIGASMPSVLVEISFITNAQEGRLLKTSAYRGRIAKALFTAVRGYQKTLKSVQALPGR